MKDRLGSLPIGYELSPRLSASGKDLDQIAYKFDFILSMIEYIQIRLRYSDHFLLNSSALNTHLMASARILSPAFLQTRFFLGGGFYKRFVLLDKTLFPNILFRSNYTEHDFVLEMGFLIEPFDQTSIVLRAATFEEIDIYNLNHPFGEVALSRALSPTLSASLVSRYHVLLGFGRMDAFSIGFKLSWSGSETKTN